MAATLRKLLILLLVLSLAACGSSGGGQKASPPQDDVALSVGSLDQPFDPNVLNYTGSVANDVTSFSMTPLLIEEGATVAINGSAVTPGQASPAIPLVVGENLITMVITEVDGVTERSYTFLITRQPAAVDLTALSLSVGTLSPTFAIETTSYSATVAGAVSSVDIIATLADATSSLTINGSPAINGIATAVNLNLGANAIPVVITAADSSTKTYTLTVTREENNASLSALTLSAGTLSPAFNALTLSYSASVPYSSSAINVTATAADVGASMTINGVAASSGVAKSVSLAVGSNPINIVVTAADSTTKTYALSITRNALSSDKTLSALSLSAGTLSPAFSSGVYSYSATVPYASSGINVTATVNYVAASLAIQSGTATSGVATAVPLTVGANAITIVVTAEDASQQTYTVNVTRTAASTNNDLAGLSIAPQSFNEVFAASTQSYTATVPYAASSVDVVATLADSLASMTIATNSASSGVAKAVALTVGANNFDVVVTSESGAAKTYSISITRTAASTDASLSGLVMNPNTINEVFASTTYLYTATVTQPTANVAFTATANDTKYFSIKINGVSAISGQASSAVAVAEGDNSINVVVTAEDGVTSKTYNVSIYRIRSDASLSALTVSPGTLDQAVQPLSTYTMTLPYLTSGMTVTPTVTDAAASLTVEGIGQASGAASAVIPLVVGSNLVNIVVTAEDGVTAHDHTITVTREALSTFAQTKFIKATNAKAGDLFATSVDISGNTLVIGAPYEDSGASGINGNQVDDCPATTNCATDSGAAYVFVRDGANWTLQAYIKAPDTEKANEQFGSAVAIDGDTIVVGASGEKSLVNGVTTSFPGAWDGTTGGGSGAAYVYKRTGTTWALEAWLKASNTDISDNFGGAVAISGDWIAVGAVNESSASVSTPNDNTVANSGAVYTYKRTGSVWAFNQYLKHSNPSGATAGQADKFGLSLALSGTTLAVGVPFDDSAANTIDGNAADDCGGAATNCLTDSGSVFIFTESGGTWTQQAYIRSNYPGQWDQFGHDVDILLDTLAVGAPREGSQDTDPTKNGAFAAGAVNILTRSGATWSHQAYLKAGNVKGGNKFGQQVALGDGYLAVGVPLDDSAGVGGSDVDDCGATNLNCATDSGGGYMFTGSGASWTLQKYMKAANVTNGDATSDKLGGNSADNAPESSILAADGGTIVFGVRLEDDSATGGDTSPTPNDAAVDSGAVYLFE